MRDCGNKQDQIQQHIQQRREYQKSRISVPSVSRQRQVEGCRCRQGQTRHNARRRSDRPIWTPKSGRGVRASTHALGRSPHLRAPPFPNLPPCHPLSAPLGQVLALRDQTLMDRTGQHGDAVPADLVAEVLAGKCICTAGDVGVKVDE